MIAGIGAGETSDTLDIGSTGGGHNQTIIETVRNKLVDAQNDGGLEPELATEWGASDDGKRWTFKLRQGVEFHNGKTLDAQDVIDSMNLHRGKDTKSGGKTLMEIVSNIRADGSDVIFDLSKPAADFPYYLATNVFNIGPSKDGVVDQSGVGTGPFILEEFDPGVRGAGKRNPNYFKEGKPYFDSFEFLSANDRAALVSGMLSGEFHAIQPVDPSIVAKLDAAPGVSVVSVPGGSTVTMPMHADKVPFDNADFRLALSSEKQPLLSSWYQLEDAGQTWRFTQGRGWGHGVGMCQCGSQQMARLGNNAVQILQHYYPQAVLVRAY